MALILWQEAYSVGVEALDNDHIVIASLINHIDEAKQHADDERIVGRLLRTLIAQAVSHFAREEELMADHGYAELEPHRNEHRMLLQQLEELYAAYRSTADPAISREIMELLNFWLVRHILKVDMRYRESLAEPVTLDQGQ